MKAAPRSSCGTREPTDTGWVYMPAAALLPDPIVGWRVTGRRTLALPFISAYAWREPRDWGPGMLTRQLYASPDGDRWDLMRSREGGLAFVRHSANEASGGTVTDIDLGSFLALGPDNPEHREMWRLIGTLLNGAR